MEILGYDNRGKVKISDNDVIRVINSDFFTSSEEIYSIYLSKNLHKLNIVETSLDRKKKKFIHKRHIISYPYEWSANMYRDAVLFHLNLFLELKKYELILKDGIPSNILFNFTEPVFVDFFSIVKSNDLVYEKWLTKTNKYKDLKKNIIEKMIEPFLLSPLIQFYNGNTIEARKNLSCNACNMTNITPRFENLPFVNKSSFLNLINLFLLRKRSISGILIQKFKKYRGYIDFYDYLELIISFISEKSIILKPSGYLNYYDKKGENADYLKKNEWSVKQKNIYKILLKTRPKTMLDFGANTGWFTFLAESLGISVIALDKEEDCVDYIYKKAKSEKKKILPLLISYSDLNREYYGKKIDRPDLKENDYSKVPIYCSPIKRLSTEIVLCLGLIHHLTLGEGDTILSIFKNISQLAQKYLIIEYVDLNDQLIAGNSSYFKNIHKFTKQTYNINLIIEAGKLYFRDIEIYDSNPETRKLILFSNKITS